MTGRAYRRMYTIICRGEYRHHISHADMSTLLHSPDVRGPDRSCFGRRGSSNLAKSRSISFARLLGRPQNTSGAIPFIVWFATSDLAPNILPNIETEVFEIHYMLVRKMTKHITIKHPAPPLPIAFSSFFHFNESCEVYPNSQFSTLSSFVTKLCCRNIHPLFLSLSLSLSFSLCLSLSLSYPTYLLLPMQVSDLPNVVLYNKAARSISRASLREKTRSKHPSRPRQDYFQSPKSIWGRNEGREETSRVIQTSVYPAQCSFPV